MGSCSKLVCRETETLPPGATQRSAQISSPADTFLKKRDVPDIPMPRHTILFWSSLLRLDQIYKCT